MVKTDLQQALAEIAVGCTEHGVHVVRRERDVADRDVLEVRRVLGDLVDDDLGHLVLEVTVLFARRLGGEGVDVHAGGVLALRRHFRITHGRDLDR